MTRPHSDGFLQEMMRPMGLHNMSDVQQYKKLVEMRNQHIMDQREDQILRQYQHVTQGLTSEKSIDPATGQRTAPSSLDRLTYATGAAKENPTINNPMEAAIHAAVKRTTKRGKRELEVAGAQVAGKPFIPRRGGAGGYMISGQEPTGARVDNVIFRRPKAKAKAGG